MSYVIEGRNVSSCFRKAIKLIQNEGEYEETRNGTVIALQAPITITHRNPWERVLFSPLRDANPFFHLFEALWMLGGRNDVAFLKQFNSNIENYSDDGRTFHGAYGHRWFHYGGNINYYKPFDQIERLILELKENPWTRRAVLAMWNPELDLNREGKDFPCNTHIYFRIVGGLLDMTVCNRSNDLVWGCFGANAVHFSILQEYMAGRLGVPVGQYHQITNNLHLYQSIPLAERLCDLRTELKNYNFYSTSPEHSGEVTPVVHSHPLYSETFHEDNFGFLSCTNSLVAGYGEGSFHETVVGPMSSAYFSRKFLGGKTFGTDILENAINTHGNLDWLVAGRDWLLRRECK